MQKQTRLKPLIRQTPKLFYDKWLYKISITGVNAWIFRDPDAVNIILTDTAFISPAAVNNFKIATILSSLPPDEYHHRCYAGNAFIFLNCNNKFEQILQELGDQVVNAYAPKGNDAILKTDNRVLLVRSLPYDKYLYIVKLKFTGVPRDTKVEFVEWVAAQGTTVKIAKSATRTILNRSYHAGPYTMYTNSEPLITFMMVKYGKIINSVGSYKLVDK